MGQFLNEATVDLYSPKQAIGTSYALGIQLSNRVGYTERLSTAEAYRFSAPMPATILSLDM